MKSEEFTELLVYHEFNFITGVPDSLFKDVLLEINSSKQFQHIISNNEGEACALATGYHLATNKFPVVYLQNSGVGNCLNPLTSLLDRYVYSIPILLLITWRGQPGKKDEPQHLRMGQILPELLNLLEIPSQVATSDRVNMDQILEMAKHHLHNQHYPYAILFPNDVFEGTCYPKQRKVNITLELTRERVLENIVAYCKECDVIVTTTGKTSRELFEIRTRLKKNHSGDFLTVGSMGCASAIAFGISLGQPHKKIFLVDGDGACLMRLETMTLIGHYKPAQLLHILVDNNSYESTGSQKTLSDTVDFVTIASACGYPKSVLVKNKNELGREISNFQNGPKLILVKVTNFSRDNLARPTTTPVESKQQFMRFLNVT